MRFVLGLLALMSATLGTVSAKAAEVMFKLDLYVEHYEWFDYDPIMRLPGPNVKAVLVSSSHKVVSAWLSDSYFDPNYPYLFDGFYGHGDATIISYGDEREGAMGNLSLFFSQPVSFDNLSKAKVVGGRFQSPWQIGSFMKWHGVVVTPEPGTWIMLILGFTAIGVTMRRSRDRHLGSFVHPS